MGYCQYLKLMIMKWLKSRFQYAIMSGVVSIIITTLGVVFSSLIGAIVVSLLACAIMALSLEFGAYHASKTRLFDWYNVLAVGLGWSVGLLIVLSVL